MVPGTESLMSERTERKQKNALANSFRHIRFGEETVMKINACLNFSFLHGHNVHIMKHCVTIVLRQTNIRNRSEWLA